MKGYKVEKGWLGREEVAERLSIKQETLNRWVEVGLITPVVAVGNILYFQADTVERFWVVFITSTEAASILGITRITVQEWARQGRFKACCISGPNIDGNHAYLFNKELLIQWKFERLSFGETQKLLGVSKATLDRWAKTGRLKVLSDTASKQRWFSREDVLNIISNLSTCD